MGDAAYTLVRPHMPPGVRGAVRAHQGMLDAFACAACGYVELYVADEPTLAYITEGWEPVTPAAPTMAPPPPPDR